jgi:hypothetical protein
MPKPPPVPFRDWAHRVLRQWADLEGRPVTDQALQRAARMLDEARPRQRPRETLIAPERRGARKKPPKLPAG